MVAVVVPPVRREAREPKKNIGVSRPSQFSRRTGRGRLEKEGAHAHPSLAAGLGVGV